MPIPAAARFAMPASSTIGSMRAFCCRRRAEDLPAREDLIAALGAEIAPSTRLALLAGCAANEVEANAAGRTVCACFAVGLRTLRDAIVEQRLTSVAEIGRALRAGTNCGSCIPELKAILRGVQG